MNINVHDIEQSLRHHHDAGNIASWFRGRQTGEYRVRLSTGSVLITRTLFEAQALTSGLTSYEFAQSRRDQAEAAQIAAAEAEREDRLARERIIQQLAITTVDCETCGSTPGTKCLREPRDPSPYAARVHEPRRDAALVLQEIQLTGQPVAA